MHYVILANFPLLSNISYFMHTVLVIMDVSYGRYQIVTLKSFVLLGRRACDAWGVFRFRLTVFCYHFQCLPVLDKMCRRSLNFVRSYIRHESAFVQFIALCGLHAHSRSLFGRNVVFCAQRFICSINDLIYGCLPIIINSYKRNSVDETTLDHVAFLRELIMIRDSSLNLSGLLSSDELNDVISYGC